MGGGFKASVWRCMDGVWVVWRWRCCAVLEEGVSDCNACAMGGVSDSEGVQTTRGPIRRLCRQSMR